MSDVTDQLNSLLDDLLAGADNGQNMTRAAMLAERISGLYDALRAQLSETQARLVAHQKALAATLDFATTVAGGSAWWDDVWPEYQDALYAAPVAPAAQCPSCKWPLSAHGNGEACAPAAQAAHPVADDVVRMLRRLSLVAKSARRALARASQHDSAYNQDYDDLSQAIVDADIMLAAQQQKAGGAE